MLPRNDAAEPTVLQVQGLCHGFPGRPLFAQWSADLPAGLTLIQGSDGTGKTTLLRLLAGDCAPHSGRLVLGGADAATQPERYRAQVFWRDPRAPWPQEVSPQDWATEFSTRHEQWSDAQWRAHVAGFGLAPHLHKAMHQLSAGSQRKVLLAAALASGAPLTLVDEPVAALDKASIAYLQEALVREASNTARAVVVAHYDTLGNLPWRRTMALPE